MPAAKKKQTNLQASKSKNAKEAQKAAQKEKLDTIKDDIFPDTQAPMTPAKHSFSKKYGTT